MSFKKVYLGNLFKQSEIKELHEPTKKSYKAFIKEIDGVVAESVNGGRQVKPYLDCDPVMSPDYTDDDWDKKILKDKQLIHSAFPDAGITIADIYAIKRKYQSNNGIKFSVHYTVDKVRMSACNMLGLFEKLDIEGFDKGVYTKNRFLTSIYTNKKIVDVDGKRKKKTLPMFMPDRDADITKYLVSYVEEDFVDWDLNFTPKVPKIEKKSSNLLELISKKYEDVDLIKALVGCLSSQRAEDYNDWLNVGFCLYCISPEFLDLWKEFSKKSDKYEEGVCEELWSKMTNKNMSVGTLKYWAKQDNPQKYEKVNAESLNKSIELCLGSDGSHYDVAVITSKIMTDKVVYDGKMKLWFFVDEKNNIWYCDREGIRLIKVLAEDVCKAFIKAYHNYSAKSLDCDPQYKVMYEEKQKKCISIAKQLKNASFQDSVKKCCKCTFRKDDFFEKYVDKNTHLWGFADKLFDTTKKIIRPIEPTDYIMTNTGYSYNDVVNVNKSSIDTMKKILEDIHPDLVRREYLLDTLCVSCFGKNFLQIFSIWNGVGANGKGIIINLLEQAFGKYFAKLSSDTITKERKGANSTSEFSRVSSCRLVVFEEPRETEKLQSDILKEHSGDTTISTRGLYQDSFQYTPQYNIIICCNEIPDIENNGGGHSMARRLRVNNFPTLFCDNPTQPHHRKCDNQLTTKIKNDPELRNAFMYIIMENIMKNDLLHNFYTPQCILDDSIKFLEGCNYVKRFLEDGYDYSEYDPKTNKDAKIASSNLYSSFKTYCFIKGINIKITDKAFKPLVEKEGFISKRLTAGVFYMNIVKKPEIEDENDE